MELCFAASAALREVTPLILRASNTTTIRLAVDRPTFCNFTPRLHQKRSQEVKFSWGGGMPPDLPSRRATRALIAYWNPPFQNSRSATADSESDPVAILLSPISMVSYARLCPTSFGFLSVRQGFL